jgi:ATP-dependent Clp endopeptidase proteolytic subunit ClpP
MNSSSRMFNSTPRRRQSPEWFKVVDAKPNEPAKVYIYDFIGADFWGDGVSAKNFVAELDKINGDIELHVNSPGGNVADAIAIRNALIRRRGVTNYIDAMAYSSASWIVFNGGRVIAAQASMVMAHNPRAFVGGEAKDLRKSADLMDAAKLDIAKMYAEKTGKSMDVISAMMDAETYFNAEEALAYGLVDEVSPGLKMAACAFDLSGLNLSDDFLRIQEALRKRESENALRDAGLSREEAKAMVSEQARRDAASRTRDLAMETLNKELRKCLRN